MAENTIPNRKQQLATLQKLREQLLTPDPDGIPERFLIRPQWVLWRLEWPSTSTKPTKRPYATTGRLAASDDLLTWSPFEDVWECYKAGNYHGIGFMFCSGDPFCGIDFDDVLNVETGELLKPEMAPMIKGFKEAHVELSPSGTGVHLITRAKVSRGIKRSGMEIYDSYRFFTVTGRCFNA